MAARVVENNQLQQIILCSGVLMLQNNPYFSHLVSVYSEGGEGSD